MKILLIYVASLNLLDTAFTLYGLNNNYINESNPLMNTIYNTTPLLFLVLKVLLSILLLVILYHLDTKKETSRTLGSFTVIAAIAYTYTCILHGYWIVELV
ncbi:DUF5658 family protein [Rossellomorea vietnamensis]|uniref:DUF5658 family protein n=1 Tax=Rossellomorea vietnamensis TaxID=218284 RepID=UPI001CCAA55A|nr:DUF5658 family protein [Rossellomorea vietnamensis]MCA0150434.1 DUF5658 family protein [Rossellomorea vietnamensis]